ncbi:NUDIX domain-containing protein [Bacillus sp. JJ1122]|uniref:NUDIX hydrolase n=1 Tax=Bacillus sp. JJ1122 TaxID=3122951 RepID=UPI002FFE26A2
MNIFGFKEDDVDYIYRPCIYGLIFNEHKDKIAVIQTDDGNYFLPGGGLENEESHEECLLREGIEEMGMTLEIGSFIGCALRYFYSANDRSYYLSEGHFYFCNILCKSGKPTEDGHYLRWLEPAKAINCLFHDHQSWAVGKVLKKD